MIELVEAGRPDDEAAYWRARPRVTELNIPKEVKYIMCDCGYEGKCPNGRDKRGMFNLCMIPVRQNEDQTD